MPVYGRVTDFPNMAFQRGLFSGCTHDHVLTTNKSKRVFVHFDFEEAVRYWACKDDFSVRLARHYARAQAVPCWRIACKQDVISTNLHSRGENVGREMRRVVGLHKRSVVEG